MAKEAIPIQKTFVRDQVNLVAEDMGFELSIAERNIVDTIIATMPEKLNGPQLGKWCNAEVESILKQYPKLKKRSDVIRNEVGKELKYLIHKDQFDELKRIIELEHPAEVTPIYIKNVSKNLSNFIYDNFRTRKGEPDWEFIAKKLGIEKIFDKIDRSTLSSDRNEAMKHIVSHLRKVNPEKFNPGWIQLNMPQIVKAIQKAFHKKDSTTIDWHNFQENLPDEWRDKFVIIKEYGRELPDIVKDMVRIFEQKNPKQLYPSYLREEFPKLYDVLITRILKPNLDQKPDWSIFIHALPTKWAERWMDADKFGEITGKRW